MEDRRWPVGYRRAPLVVLHACGQETGLLQDTLYGPCHGSTGVTTPHLSEFLLHVTRMTYAFSTQRA